MKVQGRIDNNDEKIFFYKTKQNRLIFIVLILFVAYLTFATRNIIFILFLGPTFIFFHNNDRGSITVYKNKIMLVKYDFFFKRHETEYLFSEIIKIQGILPEPDLSSRIIVENKEGVKQSFNLAIFNISVFEELKEILTSNGISFKYGRKRDSRKRKRDNKI